ncbi:hypothetical protein L1987_79066 [Smallanthus sonchifolius]|uniref:Uncharacterized protein n=1 Tax=Smallanthus sonchifolius TaxID=185202 RepID=A0ACB8ZEN5_9ASTR|nr:hypothetical protein L1987_79066 [Smallanthus sonchifolius]
MSRCFPYPPPGYCRSGAAYEALIDSIKLQKETNKTKSESKKEKRAKKEKKEKRQKEKRNNEDEIRMQKNTTGEYPKVLQKASDFLEAQFKKTNATTELFEKSDLTEEHGPSISSHQPSYSSDSTQNSNKRKRDYDSLLPDSSTTHDARSNTPPSVPSFSNSDRSVVSSIRFNAVPATSGRENRAQTTTICDPNMSHFGRIQSAQNFAKPALQSTRPQPPLISSFGRQVAPRIVSRNIDEQELHSGRQQQLAPSHCGLPNSVTSKPNTSAAGKKPNNDIVLPRNDGDQSLKKQKEDPQKVGPTQFDKKILKKHTKYEKLVGSWLPPVFQAHLPDDGGEDWLSGSKTSKSSVSKVEVETCRQLVVPWQPCARFLAEADIHALPFTVPF